ncbi:MAG TPA: protein-glutamate O-methyltransferase CheR [Gammaproteobacteria bacterium]|nr:protein-glutamate O-methyltransferase CheR [Gammaproteobacteria bacterium]
MSGQARQLDADLSFTGHDFEAVRTTLHATAGITLDADKRDLVYARLARRLRALRMTAFSDYMVLVNSPRGAEERVHFINALTTNLTAFFREPHHFDFLAGRLLPEVLRRHAADRPVRIWSAGCSTGEEPYSIAMVAQEVLASAAGLAPEILATDLDSSVIASARQGRYARERIAGLSAQRSRKWFRPLPGSGGGTVEVKHELRKTVTFRQLNLMHDWPVQGPFELIFCRNVVIYFDRPTRQRLLERFADCLCDGGYLFLGRSEVMYDPAGRFEPVGPAVYRKPG